MKPPFFVKEFRVSKKMLKKLREAGIKPTDKIFGYTLVTLLSPPKKIPDHFLGKNPDGTKRTRAEARKAQKIIREIVQG